MIKITRPHHTMLDGQIRELDEPFEVEGRKAIIQVVLVLLVKIFIVDVHYYKGQNGHLMMMNYKHLKNVMNSMG